MHVVELVRTLLSLKMESKYHHILMKILCAYCCWNQNFSYCPGNPSKANCFKCKESKFHNKKINHSANDSSCINHNIKKLIHITDFGTFILKKFLVSNFSTEHSYMSCFNSNSSIGCR